MVRIEEKGAIYRCGSKSQLGSIVTGEFHRMAPLSPCDDGFCPYYCTKHSIAPPIMKAASAGMSAPVAELRPV